MYAAIILTELYVILADYFSPCMLVHMYGFVCGNHVQPYIWLF